MSATATQAPPANPAAEEELLGAAMVTDCLGAIQAEINLPPAAFYFERHQEIFSAMLHLLREGKPISEITVSDAMKRRGTFGLLPAGQNTLADLASSVAQPGKAIHYAEIVRDKAQWRQRFEAGQAIQAAAAQEDPAGFADGQSLLAQGVEHSNAVFDEDRQRDLIYELLEGRSKPEFYYPFQKLNQLASGGMRRGQLIVLSGYTNHGKALDVRTPIATPSGWTTMGDLGAGDHVFGVDGRATPIIAATPIMNRRPCYQVRFGDGSSLIADQSHQWVVHTHASRENQERGRTVTTKGLAELLETERRGLSVAQHAPLCMPDADLPVAPYVLGAWLGAGDSRNPALTTHENDTDLVAGETPRERIASLGVLQNKHIPENYLRASIDQRLALLQGLMDADGTVSECGECEISSVNPQLVEDILELARGLGIGARMSTEDAKWRGGEVGSRHRIYFVADLPVFRLTGKLARQRGTTTRSTHRYVRAVEPVPSRPVRCIQVAARDGMFLAGRELIPTHNSHLGSQILDVNRKHGSVALYDNEMEPEEIAVRRLNRLTGVPYSAIMGGEIDQRQREAAIRFLNKQDMGWPIIRCAGWSVDDVCHHIRQYRRDLVVIDLLHNFAFSEERELAAMVRRIKMTGKQANCTIVLCSHVNRKGAEGGKKRPPLLSDLRWSGEIENMADAVCFVHREQDDRPPHDPLPESYIYFAKMKGGDIGGVKALFNRKYLRFESVGPAGGGDP